MRRVVVSRLGPVGVEVRVSDMRGESVRGMLSVVEGYEGGVGVTCRLCSVSVCGGEVEASRMGKAVVYHEFGLW